MCKILKHTIFSLFLLLLVSSNSFSATALNDYSFLIAEGNNKNISNKRFWNFLKSNNFSGVELKLEIKEKEQNVFLAGTNESFSKILHRLHELIIEDSTKVLPVFLRFNNDIETLDSLINISPVSSHIFYLPQGEAWPSLEYLIQANRRVIFFVTGNYRNSSRIIHPVNNYVLRISAKEIAAGTDNFQSSNDISLELLMVDEFDQLPTQFPPNELSRNLVPDYINFLLKTWTSLGKRPNFIFVGEDVFNFDFIIEQLKSFTWINGAIRIAERTMEKVYWRNPDVSVTGGKFSFPYRGGEEITLSPFAPGYDMTPEHIVVTGEMDIPDSYTIIASPTPMSNNLTGSFNFEGIILNNAQPSMAFQGENFSFSQDIERGNVLRLPENASVNLGSPENFGLRNSSFTVGCFVKFTEILEFGDNAVLGNYERGYRRGLHLILRSGHPYFGLWANDFVSDVMLKPNTWYHLSWRYILETGEQAIFLNGRNIGSSDGHPPFSGTGDIHLGSALSQGASLRGYIDDLYIWNRPLGDEEINRLALDEQVIIEKPQTQISLLDQPWFRIIIVLFLLVILTIVVILFARKLRTKKQDFTIDMPSSDSENQIRLFGKFKAIDKNGNDVTIQFTPKIKELFLYILLHTIKNGTGAQVSETNKYLWPGLTAKKVANNRAVTLNKLRKVLENIEGIEIVTQNSFLMAVMHDPLFCDYAEAFKLCQISEGMSKPQLEAFFSLVKNGRFLKASHWPWLDDLRGFIGNQVIDNLLHLASIYKSENKVQHVDAIARRILEYDDLNEEAIYLQIWTLQKANNLHLAKFNFDSFCTKYKEFQGEEFPMNFEQFAQHYAKAI